MYSHPIFAGHAGEMYCWSDKNGDSMPQPDEMKFAKLKSGGKPIKLESYYWGTLPGPDGTLSYINRAAHSLVQFRVTGQTPCGAPEYDIANPQTVVVKEPYTSLLGGGSGEGMIPGGANGVTYLNQDPILGIDKTGRVLGAYPSHFTSVHGSHSARSAHPGYVIGPSSIAGSVDMGGNAGELIDMNGNLGEHYIFTSDGLPAQTLFKDLRGGYLTPERAEPGVSFDAYTAGGESFGANFTRLPNGKAYLTIGSTSADVLEVTGLDTIRRLPERDFTYTPQQFEIAQKMLRAQLVQQNAPKLYNADRVTESVSLDSRRGDWPEFKGGSAKAMTIENGVDAPFARIAVRYDDKNLYIAWRVHSEHNALRNAGQDNRLLFKSGDAVDLMLSADSEKQNPPSPLRLLITRMGGVPVAVLYRKTAAGVRPNDRVPFASPLRTVYFDSVGLAPQVALGTGPADGGYFVHAAIPWSALGIKPHSGLRLRADFGALFADEGGKITAARQYWSNKATGLVNDVPGEAELTPEMWGTLILKQLRVRSFLTSPRQSRILQMHRAANARKAALC